MRLIRTEEQKGKTIFITETKRLFFKPKIRRFLAQSELTSNYWRWLELPDKLIVSDNLSLQLDAWMRERERDERRNW